MPYVFENTEELKLPRYVFQEEEIIEEPSGPSFLDTILPKSKRTLGTIPKAEMQEIDEVAKAREEMDREIDEYFHVPGEAPLIKPSDEREKGLGYFGELKRPDGMVSTELSVGVNVDGREMEIPSLVPTLTKEEIDYLLAGNEPTEQIVDKAVEHARERIKQKKSPFAQKGEQPSTEPEQLEPEALAMEGIETPGLEMITKMVKDSLFGELPAGLGYLQKPLEEAADYWGKYTMSQEEEMAMARKYPNLMAARYAVASLLLPGVSQYFASTVDLEEFKKKSIEEQRLEILGTTAAYVVFGAGMRWGTQALARLAKAYPWMSKPILEVLRKNPWFKKLETKVKGTVIRSVEGMQKAGMSEAEILKVLRKRNYAEYEKFKSESIKKRAKGLVPEKLALEEPVAARPPKEGPPDFKKMQTDLDKGRISIDNLIIKRDAIAKTYPELVDVFNRMIIDEAAKKPFVPEPEPIIELTEVVEAPTEAKIAPTIEERVTAIEEAAKVEKEAIGKEFEEKKAKVEKEIKPTVEEKVEEAKPIPEAKEAWEMRKEEFFATKPMVAIRGPKGEIYKGKPGETHVQIYERLPKEIQDGLKSKDSGWVVGDNYYERYGDVPGLKGVKRGEVTFPPEAGEQNLQMKLEHRKVVQQAISEGKITSHPDYPELGKVEKEPPAKIEAEEKLKKGIISRVIAENIKDLSDSEIERTLGGTVYAHVLVPEAKKLIKEGKLTLEDVSIKVKKPTPPEPKVEKRIEAVKPKLPKKILPEHGKGISYKTKIKAEETGEIIEVTTDAELAIKDVDALIGAYKELLECPNVRA